MTRHADEYGRPCCATVWRGLGHDSRALSSIRTNALERELLAAPVDEVREACRETGRARNIARQEIRALLNAAIAASEDSPALQHFPPDTFTV